MASITFNIKRSNNRFQPYYFDITHSSGVVLAWSETYVGKQHCSEAINLVRTGQAGFTVQRGVDWKYRFHFVAKNGRILCQSRPYDTESAARQDANLIVKEAPHAAVLDRAA